MSSRRSLIKDISASSVGEIGSRIPLMLIEIIVARYLGPAVYGIWTTVQLAVNYNNFLHFGFFSALAREEPILIAKADYEKVETVRNTAFTVVMAITILMGAMTFIAYLTTARFYPDIATYQSYIVLSYILLVFQQVFIFYQTTFQNRFLFMLLSVGKLVYSFSFLLFVVFSIVTWRLNAVIVSWSASYLITLVLFVILKPKVLPKFVFDYKEAKVLFYIGWPIFLFGIIRLLMSTVDKFVVATYLGVHQLGYYNVTATFLAITALLGGLISRVLSPHLISRVGAGDSPKEIYDYFLDKLSKSVIIISIAISVLLISLQPFLWYVLPEYISGKKAGYALIICGGISSLTQFYTAYLIAHSKQKAILFSTLFSVCVVSLLAVGIALLSQRISYIAVGSLTGWSLYLFSLSKISHKVSMNQIQHIRAFGVIIKPIFIVTFCSFALVLMQSFIHDEYGSILLDSMCTLLLYGVIFLISIRFLGAGILIKDGIDRLITK